MNLFQKIAFVVSLVFLMLLGVTTWNDFRHSGMIVEGQLKTSAENMATTLGVAIANAEYGTDPAFIESLFNVSFDAGHIAKIELIAPNGEIIHRKEQQVSIRNVPEWFIHLIPISSAEGRSRILRKWKFYGTVLITLHPGYAYAGLYENLKSHMLWFSFFAVVGLFFLWWLLNLLLQPLKKFKQQAEAILENKFIEYKPLPDTSDLRQVALAMNQLTQRAELMFNDQAESVARLHKMMYQDESTGLPNRPQFELNMKGLLADEAAERGSIAFVSMQGLNSLMERKGYRDAKQFLLDFVGKLNDISAKYNRVTTYRINERELCIHVMSPSEKTGELVEELFDDFKKLMVKAGIEHTMYLHGSIVDLAERSDLASVLSSVDYSLNQAKNSGTFQVVRSDDADKHIPQGKTLWRQWLEDAIAERRFYIATQAARDIDQSLYHQEVFLRMKNSDGATISAATFMPIATAVGLEAVLLNEMFDLIKHLPDKLHLQPLALNVPQVVFKEADALSVMESWLESLGQKTKDNWFVEANHSSLFQHTKTAIHVSKFVHRQGFKFGIDNFDLSLPLDLLREVQVDYVKLHVSSVLEAKDQSKEKPMNELLFLLRQLEIDVVTVGINSAEDLEVLAGMGIQRFQGGEIELVEEHL